MKTIVIALTAIALWGCASVPRPQVHVIAVKPKPQASSPVVTPNDQVKHRWYSKFKVHPKWFHQ